MRDVMQGELMSEVQVVLPQLTQIIRLFETTVSLRSLVDVIMLLFRISHTTNHRHAYMHACDLHY